MKPDCTNRKNIPSTCGTAGFLNHPQYDWSVKFLNASPPKIIFLGLVPPRKHCMRADYDTLHCRLDLLGNFEHSSSKNPLLFYTILIIPNPQQSRKFLPIPISPQIFFRIAKRHLDKPNFCPAIASLANSALHRHVYRTKAMALEDTTRMSSTSPEQRLNPNPSGISVYCTGFLGILIHPAQI